MRDITNNGAIGRIVVQEGSSLGRPLTELTTEQLGEEKEFRKERLHDERTPRVRRLTIMLVCGVVLAMIAFAIYRISGDWNLTNIIVGVVGVAIAAAGLYFNWEPSKYERDHIAALSQIADILRLRGVK